MSATNLVFEGFGRDERIVEDKSQWFSPPEIAWRMRRWAGDVPVRFALEPSAGSGNLVHALRVRQSGTGDQAFTSTEVDAYELDPYYADRLRERFPDDPDFNSGGDVRVHQTDYLAAKGPGVRYDLGFANPPYEDGLDGRFLAKMMDECDRIVALVRLATLAGQERSRDVWSRVASCEWRMTGLAIFGERPKFQAGRAVGDRRENEGGKTDFCVVKLSRLPGPTSTEVEWW